MPLTGAEKQRRFRERHGEQGRAANRRRYANTPAKWAAHIKRMYGLTLESYEALVRKQNGVCAICEDAPVGRLHVDHDHRTGAVRGLLCAACNRVLGQARDSTKILRRAAQYLTDCLI